MMGLSKISKKHVVLSLAMIAGSWQQAHAQEEALESINLQETPWTVIAEETGIFDEEFSRVGVNNVNLVAEGAAEMIGAETAAVKQGALAIAQRMIYPATVHKANGVDSVIVWSSGPSNRYRAPILASAANDEVNTLGDLEGKKLGSSRVSCYWSSPFEALDVAGLPMDTRERRGKVRYSSIDNTAVALSAVLSGALDATAVHLAAGNATGAWLSGKFKIIGHSPADGVYVNHAGRVTYFATRAFSQAHPEAIQAFLKARERTMIWATDNVEDAAEIVSKRLRLPLDVARFQITTKGQWEFMSSEPSAESVRNSIATFQRWYIDHGDTILAAHHLSEDELEDFVDDRFFEGGEYSIYL